MITGNVVLWTSKKLKNGKSPLVYRIQNRGRKIVYTGIYIYPEDWNKNIGNVKASCPNYNFYKKRIAEKHQQLDEIIWDANFRNLSIDPS